jgi:hypothetical protein
VQHRSRTIQTLLGPVRVRRSYYHCRACGACTVPYAAAAGLGAEAVSPPLAKAVTMLAVDRPFRQASALVKELTGQSVGAETIRRLTTRLGGQAARREDAQAAAMRTWTAPPAEATPGRLYVTADGVLVRLAEGFKEAKTVVCYGDDARGQPTRRVTVRFEPAEAFRAHAWATACRHGLEQARETVLLGDGAAWIWEHVGGVLGEEATHIVDWYHAAEHVWDCGKVLHGEAAPQTAAWVESILTWLHDGRVRDILQRLKAERAATPAPDQQAALGALITYVTNQDDRLAYDRFRARGLDIGSGQVEAACKNVVAARMKGSGMRWSPHGAQAVLSLRCCWINGDWPAFWSRRPLAQAA